LTTLTRALAMLALAALLVGLLGAAVIAGSDHVDHPGLTIAAGLGIGAAWIGTGLFAWWRRPENRFGALMTWTGFAWLVNAFTAADDPAVFTFAVLFSNVYVAAFVHLLLAYPDGRVTLRARKRLVAFGYALAAFGPLPMLMFGFDQVEPDINYPDSIFQISENRTIGRLLDAVVTALAVALVVYLLWVLLRRLRAATASQRRAMAPVVWSGVALMVLLVGTLSTQTISGSDAFGGLLYLLVQIIFASVPFTFLVGLLRTRVARADAIGELLLRLGEEPRADGLRFLLAEALDDPSLQLVYWNDGRWVRRDGSPATLPQPGDRRRAWTAVDVEGQRVGAFVHDASLLTEPDALQAVAAAAGLAMQNEQLQASLRARLDDLRRSRSRIVEAGLAERRRLERNLHDGAQQRLVALSLSLRIAQKQISKAPEKAETMVAEAQEELTRALEELRELARGIHPAVLSDRGLQAAVEALAVRSPLPVRVVEVPGERLPEPVEAAAYFVISEALTNVAKYAQANEATVAVRRVNGHAEVEIADDGVGGADPGRGSGLRGLADRVGALDGSLSLDSPPGSGTTLRAEIPV
jgi:signal transduction histidine kinase